MYNTTPVKGMTDAQIAAHFNKPQKRSSCLTHACAGETPTRKRMENAIDGVEQQQGGRDTVREAFYAKIPTPHER